MEKPRIVTPRETLMIPEGSREKIKSQYLEAGTKLSESAELFPFPGITPEAYRRLKQDEEEYPGYATPIDDFIARCSAEGMKVVVSGREGNQDVFIHPAMSTDELDYVSPRHLVLEGIQNSDLRQLVTTHRALKNR